MSSGLASVALRGLLYVMTAALPAFIDGILQHKETKVTSLNALLAATIALRAYIDGSAERHRQVVSERTIEMDPVP